MVRKLVAVLAALCLLGFSFAAAAQGGGAGYTKKRVFDFEGDDIEGSLLSPDGQFLGGDLKVKFKTLIEYRAENDVAKAYTSAQERWETEAFPHIAGDISCR